MPEFELIIWHPIQLKVCSKICAWCMTYIIFYTVGVVWHGCSLIFGTQTYTGVVRFEFGDICGEFYHIWMLNKVKQRQGFFILL